MYTLALFVVIVNNWICTFMIQDKLFQEKSFITLLLKWTSLRSSCIHIFYPSSNNGVTFSVLFIVLWVNSFRQRKNLRSQTKHKYYFNDHTLSSTLVWQNNPIHVYCLRLYGHDQVVTFMVPDITVFYIELKPKTSYWNHRTKPRGLFSNSLIFHLWKSS